MSYFKFDKMPSDKHKHYFLSEELMVPMLNHSDAQRINMFSSHLYQTVTLKNPEFPKVFTNFEDQVGKYSTGYRKADRTFRIVEKIWKNDLNYDLIVQYSDNGEYDIVSYRCYDRIEETYGTEIMEGSPIKGAKVGDTVKKGDMLYSTPSYREDGTFGYGVNLKAVYIPWKGLTYEDAVVISESAAKKLVSYKVDQVMLSVNANNVLLNLYGKHGANQSLPKIGEMTAGSVLCASRQKSSKTVMYDFQYGKMNHIESGDTITYCAPGKVVDVDIYSNKSSEDLRENGDPYMVDIANRLDEQTAYCQKLRDALEKIIPVATEQQLLSVMSEGEKIQYKYEKGRYRFDRPLPKELNECLYTDRVGYMWKRVHEILNPRIRWRHDTTSFNSVRMIFTVLDENPITPGCKVTGRYGNKGVVSLVEKDDNMPITSDGVRAEVILNPYGVINRINPSQLFEQNINFMADHVVALMKGKDGQDAKSKLLFSFLGEMNPEESKWYSERYDKMSQYERDSFLKDIEENGIFVHEPPFFGNTPKEAFEKIRSEHPEWCSKYKCDGIELPLTIGDIYFIRLKHESGNKASVRSSGPLSQKNMPLKQNVMKEHSALFPATPIAVGNMEKANLDITDDPKVVSDFMRLYSTSQEARESLIEGLLTAENPMRLDAKVPAGRKTISRDILDQYLKVIGLRIKDGG